MGSPNFKTANVELNVATFPFNGDYEDQDAIDDQQYYIDDLRDVMQNVVDEINTGEFWEVVLEYGYHEGFQVYISSRGGDDYQDQVFQDLHKYDEAYLPSGYPLIMEDLAYARKGAVNITPFNLKYAIDSEYKAIHNLLLKAAQENGLGEVFGGGYTSHVGKIESKKL